MSSNDSDRCQDSKCPAEPIVGGHTKGISTSGPGANADCSGRGK